MILASINIIQGRKMARLKQGDVLEVLLDNNKNKGYIVYLAKSNPFNYKLFGLCAVIPSVAGYGVEEIAKKTWLSTIMIFEDNKWKKIGNIKIGSNFEWPDFYESVIDTKNKFRIYHWGDGNKEKVIRIVEGKDKIGNAQPGSVFYPEAALIYYREKLREAFLYKMHEDASDIKKELEKEMAFSGLYGEVYSYTKDLIKVNKDEIVKKVKCVYQSELLFPDTSLQFYMGVLKAQLEEHCVDNEVVRSYQQLVNQEKEYLNKEEWLSEQVQKLNNELKKFNR